MSLNNFIPTYWSQKLIVALRETHVFGQPNVANRDYEGVIRNSGDTVKINSVGPVTVGNYTKNTDITDPQELSDGQTTLVIDQAKYFNFQVDDIDQAQQTPKVIGQGMQEAAYALNRATDLYLAATLSAGTPASNNVGTSGVPKTISAATDAYNYAVALKTILDMNNVPSQGRWLVIPPWLEGSFLKDDRFVHDSTATSTQALLAGEVGRAAGFTILQSNNLPVGAAGAVGDYYEVFAGTSMALSFAEQIVSVEAYRPQKRFADAIKGLHVYGAKVVRPEAVARLYVTRNE